MLIQKMKFDISALAGLYISIWAYKKIREKDVRHFKKCAIITTIVSFCLFIAFVQYSELMSDFFLGSLVTSFGAFIIADGFIAEAIVSQLLERQRPKYHGISDQYNWEDFTCKETMELYEVLEQTFEVCSWHLITQETELEVSIKKDANEHIEVGIGIKQLTEKLEEEKLRKLNVQLEAIGMLSKNIHIALQYYTKNKGVELC